MARPTAPLRLLSLALALLSIAAPADAVAPRREWRTILTPHFRVHYHEGLGPLAQRIARIGEDALDRLAERLAHRPEDPIHVVLTDETDGPNGFAEVLPHNVVTLFAAVPEPQSALGEYDDYWRLLLTHELAHVVHLDTIGGIPAAVNRVIGKQLAPNQIQPRWFIEGLATWLESDLGSGGRIRSSLFEMILRAQALDGSLPAIDEITSSTRRFPGGTSPYLYGGRFLAWLARTYGSDAMAEVSIRYGSRLVPYGMNIVAEEVFGLDYPGLWDEWQAHERTLARDVADRVRAEGPSPRTCATNLAADLRAPRVGPGGTLAIFEAPRDDDAEITFRPVPSAGLTALGPPVVRVRSPSGAGAFTGDGRFVAVIDDVHDMRFRYRDLEIIDVATGDRTRRTSGARLSDPDVFAGTIVAVDAREGSTGLVTLPVDGDEPPRALVPHALDARQIFGPRWSPDGSRIAASIVAVDGTRGIVLVDPRSGAIERITETTALEQAPTWTPDGRRLIYVSDRGGVLELFALDVATREISRLTASLTGALDPVVDREGRRVYYLTGTAHGVALCSAELDALAPRPVRDAVPRPAALTALDLSAYPDEPYADWETLLPRTVRATASLSSATGFAASVQLSGDDVVGRHAWGLTLGVDTELDRLSYNFGYANRMMPATVSVTSFLGTDLQTNAFLASNRRLDRRTSAWGLRFGLDVPLGRWDYFHGFFFGYGVELRRPLDPVPRDPFQREPRGLGRLTLAPLTAGWRISTARGFVDSISTAAGFAFDVSTTVHHPWLGSGVEVTDVSSHFTRYFSLPWADHHVLALRASGAVSFGVAGSRSTYALGGLDVRNIVRDAIEERSVGTDVIRGYPPGARRGSAMYLASLEYRLPLVDVERGIDTLPAFVDRLHLAVFSDAGDAPVEAPRLEDLAVGVGAELRLDVVLAYFVPFRLRFGYARGFAEDGVHDVYLVFGGTF